MNDIDLNRYRVERLAAAIERISDGNRTEFGKRLGYKDGAFIRQMLSELRPISEKTIRAIELIPGMKGWFDGNGREQDGRREAPWPFTARREDYDRLKPEDRKALDKTLTGFIAGTLARYEIEEVAGNNGSVPTNELGATRNTMKSLKDKLEAARTAAPGSKTNDAAGPPRGRGSGSR